ncbi:MAG: peroxiredoxin [Verrucomicrobiaceae bacterium]|nr:peroxiredoxin [Verrucomicrobiaceae bacterium]
MKHTIAILVTLGLVLAAGYSFANQGTFIKPPYAAPAVTSIDQDGKAINFGDYYKKGITVVYFYPKADTPGCTKQGCSLRDAHADLTAKGVQVLGVSVDKPEANKKFQDKFHLPFPLVCDTDGKVLEAFKVSKIPLIGLASRQCFVIKDGKVVWHDAKASTDKQADDIKEVLKELGK